MVLRKRFQMQNFKYLRVRFSPSFNNSRNLTSCCQFSYQNGLKTDRVLNNNFAYPTTFKRYESTDTVEMYNANLSSQRDMMKQIVLRGKAATTYQETLLNDFITTKVEATPEEWKMLSDKIFELNFGLINELNIDAKILDACILPKNLSLARNYLNYMKYRGRKLNAATASNFLKICYECRLSLIDTDKLRVQQFVNVLLTKYKIVDANTTDGIVKGLIISGMVDKCFEILENLQKSFSPLISTYSAIALCLLHRHESERALKYCEKILGRGFSPDDEFFITWIELYKNDREKLDRLLFFCRQHNIKLTKIVCDHLCVAYGSLPKPEKLEGKFGCVTNQGQCNVCKTVLNPTDLTEAEFDNLRNHILEEIIVGNDIFKNSNPNELNTFFDLVQKSVPFNVVIDGLNVAYMAGTNMNSETYTGFIANTVKYFSDNDQKIFLIGRKHMKKWKKLIPTLNEYNVKYFFIDDVSEDDPYLIYATMCSGLYTLFVTRDLFRSEKFGLSEEKHRALFKRWQQSHQIFIQYIAPSGRLYCRAPILFQMEVQQTNRNGWHIPYKDEEYMAKDDYGIHRKWLCLSRNNSQAFDIINQMI